MLKSYVIYEASYFCNFYDCKRDLCKFFFFFNLFIVEGKNMK